MKININQLNKSTDKVDVFICSASFEERCLTIPSEISELDIKNSFIFYNANHVNTNGENLKKLTSKLKNSKAIKLDSRLPLVTYSSFNDCLNSILTESESKHIMLDITTFTHEALLILLRLLYMRLRNKDILTLVYINAAQYSYNEPDPEKKWLSKGIGNIRSVLGYPGFLTPSQKNHLIVLFGFESERTIKLIDNFEYDLVSIGLGPKDASITNEHYKINLKRHNDIVKHYPQCKKFEFSLIDPWEAKSQIINQVSKNKDYNVVIAPLNNKISTVGAALAALENINIQLCYISANQYNLNGYSLPGEDCYIFKFQF